MAQSPSLGSFDADGFRKVIRATMIMGSPNKTEHKVRFHWSVDQTYDTADPAGHPYDWTEPASISSPPVKEDVIVPVAVQYTGVGDDVRLAAGDLTALNAELTLLDVDYELVKGADLVYIGGREFVVRFVAPPVALFSVDVYSMYVVSEDLTRPVDA